MEPLVGLIVFASLTFVTQSPRSLHRIVLVGIGPGRTWQENDLDEARKHHRSYFSCGDLF
jgi:hypothetical protein